ncbi:MAG: hypothetical protein HC846_03825 [Blastocatellia bacterium]|nr:hypothetical protein [Blastocatellia bacterium]
MTETGNGNYRVQPVYRENGFVPGDEAESVSQTLEYAYDDWCIAAMAKRAGNNNAATDFGKRSQFWKNLFDPQSKFFRARRNNMFTEPFAAEEVNIHYTEANAWHYSLYVPQDIRALTAMHGGNEALASHLDKMFTSSPATSGREQADITGCIGQYAHGNEPSHHIPYLFNHVGQPHKTQFYVRKILDEFYKNAPDGLIGNEDCGQMSAWYILSALGFYQVNPGREFYDIGTPLFKEAKINLENGKSFVIKAANVSDTNIYVKSVKLNGSSQKSTMFAHRDLMNGGMFEFEMTDTPNETAFSEFSKSAIGNTDFVSAPLIEAKDRVFKGSTTVSIKSNSKDAKILYSIDGGEPNLEYKQEFTIDKTTTIKAVAINSKGEKSQIVESKLNRLNHDWTVKLFSTYNRQYTGGGEQGLVDGIRGTVNFASGEWQGYQAQDFVAVIDLQRETEIKKLGGGFLQVARSWIWMPTKIEFETSNDNVNFTKVAEIKTDVSPEDMSEQFKDYKTSISPVRARYVRVKATNLGKIPSWHPGAGDNAFIFVDEIFIE